MIKLGFLESARAVGSVAIKEFLHVWRDRRILILIVLLPPLLTVIFGHAFEVTALRDVHTLLEDRDNSPRSQQLIELLNGNPTFVWEKRLDGIADPDLLREHVKGALVIPKGWGDGLANGQPIPLRMILDGSDTTTALQMEGELQKTLGEFQMAAREELISGLPEDVLEVGLQLPVELRNQFTSVMTPWTAVSKIRYNPQLRFIDFATPGIMGLIMQLMTVTLMACTITRERETGTLSQLLITSLRRSEIVVGKVLPYLCISLFLISSSGLVAHFYFHVSFKQPLMLGVLNFLFLACSLGSGLLISAFCKTQAQAIQFAVFFLLPVFLLSGSFAPLEQLPSGIRIISETFPLTHYCRAFRLINLYNADFSFVRGDLLFLAAGVLITCGGAAYLLNRAQE